MATKAVTDSRLEYFKADEMQDFSSFKNKGGADRSNIIIQLDFSHLGEKMAFSVGQEGIVSFVVRSGVPGYLCWTADQR